MSPFRRDDRDEEQPTGESPAVPNDDQWFRPEEPSPAAPPSGRAKGRPEKKAPEKKAPDNKAPEKKSEKPAKGADKKTLGGRRGAAAPPPSPEDAPTELFHRPDNWADVAPASGAAAAETGPIDLVTDGPAKPPKKKKHRLQKAMWSLLVMSTVGFFLLLMAYSKIEVPDPNESARKQTSLVLYAGGKEEIGRFGDTNRTIVTLDRVPLALRDAVLAAENRNFYSDNGVSPKGMARALWVNLRGGSTQGGSTITQQYVKNYYLTQERTIKRKLREGLLSIKIDREKSKDQILEDYLNTIYLGRGAYGVQAAAKAYFDKDVSRLTTAESAVLASIVRSPGRYDPSERAGLANLKVRWKYVADAMVETGKLTPEQRLKVKFPKFPAEIKAPQRYGGQRGYILTAIRKELQARGLTKEDIENGGLRIVTTLDPLAQQAALDAVAGQFPKTKNKGLRVGLAAVQPGTGRIIAMYGGEDFLANKKYAQVNTAMVPIQPGSSLKPFTLAAALERNYSLSSTFWGNSPLKLPGSPPVNNEFDDDFGSSVTLKRGLELSVNTVYVDATQRIGASTVRRALVRAGIPNDAPGLATNARITLGIASLRATEVADAYATLCSGGIYAEQHLVERVLGPNGGELPIRRPEISAKPVFSPGVVSDTIKAMQGVVESGTGTKAKKLGRPAAGKTGTHQDLTAWFNGCTPQLAASVVYFKNDGTDSLDGSGGMETFFGGTYPTLTWTAFMKAALKGQPIEKFKVAKDGDQRAAPAPTADPYGTFSGFEGTNPTAPAAPEATTGPVFPEFDPGPDTFSPAPSPTPTLEPTAPPLDPGTAPPAPENCTDDPNDPDPSKVFPCDAGEPANPQGEVQPNSDESRQRPGGTGESDGGPATGDGDEPVDP